MPRVTKERSTNTAARSPYTNNEEKSKSTVDIPKDNAVADNLDYDLLVMFIGINPGLTSAARGHHFAGNIIYTLFLSLSHIT